MILTRENPYTIFRVEDASWQGHITFPIRSDTLTFEHFTIHYEWQSFESIPTMHVLDIDSGLTEVFQLELDSSEDYWLEPQEGLPYSIEYVQPYLFTDSPEWDPILEFNYHMECARHFRNEDLLAGTISFSKDSDNEVYLGEHREIMDRVGTPLLGWTQNIDSRDLEGQAGWALSLNGVDWFEEVHLGFALEADRDGLVRLIELMKDPAHLRMNLALISPKKAAMLTALETLEGIRLKQGVPPLTPSAWYEKLQEENLGSIPFKTPANLSEEELEKWEHYSSDRSGVISPVQSEIGNNVLPVAIRVFVPPMPNMLLSEESSLAEKSLEEISSWMKSHPIEVIRTGHAWDRRFRELVGALGYRLLEVPSYSKARYWITDLTPLEWNKIEVGIFIDTKDAESAEFLDDRLDF